MFPSLPPPEKVIPIVGITVTDNGSTCTKHHFGWGNLLLSTRIAHGCGVLLHLRRTASPNKLAAYVIWRDGINGCMVGFTPREHAVGDMAICLMEYWLGFFELFTPEHPNMLCRALYHGNRGCALAAMVDKDVWVFVFNSRKLISTFTRENCLIYCNWN